jgi:predicted phage terminase large subunit-like protein
MEDVRKILTGTIYPMMVETTILAFIFTPWRDNDPVVTVTNAENFVHIKTPAYVEDETGEFFKPLGKNIKLLKSFAIRDLASLENRYVDSGSVEFARMYALDLTKAGNQEFKWYDFPSHLIKYDWFMVGGADYASSLKNWSGAQTDSDYYALAYVAKLPEGGAVVCDGILEKTTLLSALYYAERAQEIYSGWKGTVVETDGKGTEFVQSLYMLKPDLKIIPSGTKGKNKHVRLREMAPWFENGRVRISDANTPFLNELRKEMRLFPNTPHDDAMDAVYWALTAIMDVLQMPKAGSSLPGTLLELKKPNPFNSFARR